MKKIILMLAFGLLAQPIFAQSEASSSDEGYKFTIQKEVPITSVKNQSRAGTCWCYSGTAFLEAELLRMGKGEYDLSEMYTSCMHYRDRAEAAIRTHGSVIYSQGGAFQDVLYCMEHYGLVPEVQMRPGVMYGDTLSNHAEHDALTGAMVRAIAKDGKVSSLQSSPAGDLLAVNAVQAVNQVYLGTIPEKFTYKGVEYTPMSFYQSLGLNADDYVSITSFSHRPLYKPFALEIPDNWRWSLSYNVTLDELIEIADYALHHGYTVGWDSDVSEKGFRLGTKKGFCVLPAEDVSSANLQGSDMARWTGMSASQLQDEAKDHPTPQRWVTPEERQRAYNNWETQDDHLMLIYGLATDQMGNPYYMVKNSWGDYNEYHGMFFCSKAFYRYKTINILLHKDALSPEMKSKLNLK